jgi:hypothetical protein
MEKEGLRTLQGSSSVMHAQNADQEITPLEASNTRRDPEVVVILSGARKKSSRKHMHATS